MGQPGHCHWSGRRLRAPGKLVIKEELLDYVVMCCERYIAMMCAMLVLKLESSNPEHGPRYAVHCVQALPEQSFKSTQFDKYITLPEHGSTTLSFSVIVRTFLLFTYFISVQEIA